MVSCTECVHYNACSMWQKATEGLTTLSNRFLEADDKLPHIHFPGVKETKKELCEHYEKAKVK